MMLSYRLDKSSIQLETDKNAVRRYSTNYLLGLSVHITLEHYKYKEMYQYDAWTHSVDHTDNEHEQHRLYNMQIAEVIALVDFRSIGRMPIENTLLKGNTFLYPLGLS